MAENEENFFKVEDFEDLRNTKGTSLDMLAAVVGRADEILHRPENQPPPESSTAREKKVLHGRQEKTPMLESALARARNLLLRRREKLPMPESPDDEPPSKRRMFVGETSSAAYKKKGIAMLPQLPPPLNRRMYVGETSSAAAKKKLIAMPPPLPQEFERVIRDFAGLQPPPPPPNRRMHVGETSAAAAKRRRIAMQPPPPPPPQNQPDAPAPLPPPPPQQNQPAAALPAEYLNVIGNLAGGRAVGQRRLIIQKTLTKTDVAKNNNRLSIPFSQISDDFLTAEEKAVVNNKEHFTVTMIVPSLETETVKFNRWDMPKDNGSKTSSTYVLNGKWNDVVRKNGLREGKIVQLWCFRIGLVLHLALRLLPPA